MLRIEYSKSYPYSREKVFRDMTDYESLPSKYPDNWRSAKIIERKGPLVRIELQGSDVLGDYVQTLIHTPPERIDSEVDSGKGAGSKEFFYFAEDAGQTKVTWVAELVGGWEEQHEAIYNYGKKV